MLISSQGPKEVQVRNGRYDYDSDKLALTCKWLPAVFSHILHWYYDHCYYSIHLPTSYATKGTPWALLLELTRALSGMLHASRVQLCVHKTVWGGSLGTMWSGCMSPSCELSLPLCVCYGQIGGYWEQVFLLRLSFTMSDLQKNSPECAALTQPNRWPSAHWFSD